MAYDATKPLDDGYLADAPAELRELHRALKEDKIVNAGKLKGYEPGNANGNIPLNNGTLNTNLNADMLDGHDSAYFSAATHVHSAATENADGFMTATQLTKLNGIATGAEVNQNAFSNVTVGSSTIQADGKTDTLELVAGTGITLTADTTNDKVTIGTNFQCIELTPSNSASHGGFIDFHYGGSSSDYTSRIIESSSGNININGISISSSSVTASNGFNGNVTGNVQGNVTGNLSGNADTASKIETSNIDTINIDSSATGSGTYVVGLSIDKGTRPVATWVNVLSMDCLHFCTQIGITVSNAGSTFWPEFYFRSKYNSTAWSSWQRLLRSTDKAASATIADTATSATTASNLSNDGNIQSGNKFYLDWGKQTNNRVGLRVDATNLGYILTSNNYTDKTTPKPSTSSGVGQLVSWNGVDSYTLPSGGTWLVIADSHAADSSYCTLQYHGLYSGGSKITGSLKTSGLAWRIA